MLPVNGNWKSCSDAMLIFTVLLINLGLLFLNIIKIKLNYLKTARFKPLETQSWL